MAGHFSDEFLDEVRLRNDLVQIVSQYVPLQQKSRRYWGCCPFHSEKTPSFSVDPDKQFYYCFGCHEGGNVIHFIMKMEKMTFGGRGISGGKGRPAPAANGDSKAYQEKKRKNSDCTARCARLRCFITAS
ncbi:MAG: CHC2 zinc finger domain-containing protein [Christensenellales bacterium]